VPWHVSSRLVQLRLNPPPPLELHGRDAAFGAQNREISIAQTPLRHAIAGMHLPEPLNHSAALHPLSES
jgi:hypothetical protein